MERSPLHQQGDTLPDLVRAMVEALVPAVADVMPPASCREVARVFVTGCGDSHHAAVVSELALEQLSGLPCEPMTAMQFGRYAAGFLPDTGPGSNLLLAISVSGQVSRTVEALEMARQAGATAVAVTGNVNSPLARSTTQVLETRVPPLPDELAGQVVPGTRSYIASLLALFLAAIHLGQQRGHLSPKKANQLRREIAGTAGLMEQTIARCDGIAGQLARSCPDDDHFVFCGAGPNHGAAMFSAAKLLEASGDAAVAQDLEEWAHLQYFGRRVETPMFIISAGGRDESRALEVAQAASAIGRRLAIIAPADSTLARAPHGGLLFPLAGPIRECFSPLVTSLPGVLFAAARAQHLDEPYFRGFGGGRSAEGGGGISRIRSSQRMERLDRGI